MYPSPDPIIKFPVDNCLILVIPFENSFFVGPARLIIPFSKPI